MTWVVAALIFVISGLYAAVGQAGASGYLAAMALAGVEPDVMRPTALALNVVVAMIASGKFGQAGHFSGRLFWPLALGSVPMAFWGGRLKLPTHVYGPTVGVLLLLGAWRLWSRSSEPEASTSSPAYLALVAGGAAIGLVSGLTGTGGGIFLGPLLLHANWASPEQTSGTTAPFILVNSAAALIGLSLSQDIFSGMTLGWTGAAAAGGYLGAAFGSHSLSGPMAVKLLSALLVVAGVKLMTM